MPLTARRPHNNIDTIWKPDFFKLWSRGEIHRYWLNHKNAYKEFDERYTMLYRTAYRSEALIVAAVFMREVNDHIESCYFDLEGECLYLYYGHKLLGYDTHSQTVRENILNEAKKKTLHVMKQCLNRRHLSITTVDLDNMQLFNMETV